MYLIGGQRYEAGERAPEHALGAAYDRRVRPLCLCSEPPIPVYIARRAGTFVFKRMPLTGSQHAVSCSHFEPPPELSRLGEVLGTAISENLVAGVTQLHVGFSLSKGAPRAIASGTGQASQDSGTVGSNPTRLSLLGLLHLLWHDAGLTRWHPGFLGKRSWPVVRSHLLAAATSKLVRGVPLADLLYVPEAFAVAGMEAIRMRRAQRFATGLRRWGQNYSKMILVGEIKEIIPAGSHFKMVIKHVPDLAFLLSSDLHKHMVRRFDSELSLWGSTQNLHLVAAATFALTRWGRLVIDEIGLATTTAQWLPVDNRFELQLIDRLVGEHRAFDKTLDFYAMAPSPPPGGLLLNALHRP